MVEEQALPVGRPKGATKPFKIADIDRMIQAKDIGGLRNMLFSCLMKLAAREAKTKIALAAAEIQISAMYLLADMLGYEVKRRQASAEKISEKLGKMTPVGEDFVIEAEKPKPSFSEDI